MKLDQVGDIVWEKTYSYSSTDSNSRGRAIYEDSNGYLVIAGSRVDEYNDSSSIVYLVEPDDGTKIRDEVSFGSSTYQQKAYDIIEDEGRDYVYAGQYNDTGASDTYDFYLCKLESSLLYVDTDNQFDPSDEYTYDEFTSVIENSDGNYAAVGWGTYNETGTYNYRLQIIDPITLNSVDSTEGPDTNHDTIINDFTQTADGPYLVAGGRYVNADEDLLLEKIDNTGLSATATKTFDSGGHEEAEALFEDSEGNVVAAGSSGWSYFDIYLVKTDAEFNEI